MHDLHAADKIVRDIKKRDYDVYERISAVKENGGIIKTYATDHMRKRFKPGQDVECICDNNTYEGKVTFVARQPDINVGLYEVVIKLNNVDACNQHIVHIKANVDKYRDVFVIPNKTIVRDAGISYVWKVKNSKAVLVPIKGVFSDGHNMIVQSGLSVGDKIVYRGQSFLSDGAKVDIIDNNN